MGRRANADVAWTRAAAGAGGGVGDSNCTCVYCRYNDVGADPAMKQELKDGHRRYIIHSTDLACIVHTSHFSLCMQCIAHGSRFLCPWRYVGYAYRCRAMACLFAIMMTLKRNYR